MNHKQEIANAIENRLQQLSDRIKILEEQHQKDIHSDIITSVENFDKKKEAFEIALKKIDKCNMFLKNAQIKLIGGSVERPIDSIFINGKLSIEDLKKIYDIITYE